ncbi:MAG: hypothetical protein Q8Q44_00805, partial [Nocardioides sp.]|nr:hypothetical protein [Nocardioides sp.]
MAAHIDRNRERYLSFDDGVRAVEAGTLNQPAIALSFDDGFVSNVAAARMLAERNLTGVFYVP